MNEQITRSENSIIQLVERNAFNLEWKEGYLMKCDFVEIYTHLYFFK